MPPTMTPVAVPLHEVAAEHGGLSLISYNVLLPNSVDGWWVFKYYDGATPDAARTWAHRQSLLSQRLLREKADIVCIQEASPDTFATDFAFMTAAGYSALIHRKSRLRPATFWQKSSWELVFERHRDKVLITLLRSRTEPNRVLCVLNCHLTAAPRPERRFRQVFDALDQLRKDLKRHDITPEQAGVVVCGDFNADPAGSATDHLLRGGTIDADFREPQWPERSLSSKVRAHVFPPMVEVYREALSASPVTLIGSRLTGLVEDGQPTATFFSAIDALFDRFADAPDRMSWTAVEAWLLCINRAPDRGSEYRAAQAVVAEKGEPWLSRAEFAALYAGEMAEGKYWSVLHDLQAGDVLPEGERTLYTVSLDRIYASTGRLEPVAAWDPLTGEQRTSLMGGGIGLPNAWHPSDHLPIGVVLRWISPAQ